MSFVYDLYVDHNLNVAGDTNIEGNLYVQGTTTSIATENLNVKDRHIYLNDGYTNGTSTFGGIIVNYLPTSTNTTVGGAGFTTTTTVETDTETTFNPGDIIQISFPTPETYVGNKANFGIYQVLTHTTGTPNVLTIDTTTDNIVQTAFEIDATTGATITKINVSLLQANATGIWETTFGSSIFELGANLKPILLAGGSTSNTSITLTDTTNQIIFDPTAGTFDMTLSAPEPGQDSVVTIPDPGTATADFVLTEGAQTLNGAYTIGSSTGSLLLEDSNQSDSYTIAPGDITSASTYTLPSLTGSHTFIVENDTTGQILADTTDAGTASQPTYGFTADTDTGMYLDSGTSLNFAYGSADILKVSDTGITVNGTITADSIINGVMDYTGAGPHELGTDGKEVNTVTHSESATVTLPTAPTDGTKFTIINLTTDKQGVVINAGGAEKIENDTLTSLTLKRKWQRVTVQYTAVNTKWYIV